jgi:hypothetical protein
MMTMSTTMRTRMMMMRRRRTKTKMRMKRNRTRNVAGGGAADAGARVTGSRRRRLMFGCRFASFSLGLDPMREIKSIWETNYALMGLATFRQVLRHVM